MAKQAVTGRQVATRLLRAFAQVVATLVALCLAAFLLELIVFALPAAAPVVGAAFLLLVVATPFAVILLHFRFQSPPESSVALAFATGLLSCALVLLLLVMFVLWFPAISGGP